MDATFNTFGAIVGLLLAIALIARKVHPTYGLVVGALVGGLVGGGDLSSVVSAMTNGASAMTTATLRILTSGVLVGALVKTGSAESIADAIVKTLGERFAVASICLATMLVCSVGVFIDVAVITAAPIAFAVGRRANLSKSGILLAMVGGGKAGNIISPNPNTIETASVFQQDLTSVMFRNLVPAVVALLVAIAIASALAKRKNDPISEIEQTSDGGDLPNVFAALSGPFVIVALLALRPFFGITVDPLVALPIGGAVSAFATRKAGKLIEYSQFGMEKVAGIAILLIGAGAISGIVKESSLQHDFESALVALKLPAFMLAPISGVLMAGATGSTTAGASVASRAFAETLNANHVSALASAAMINAGATVFDSFPHGSFFHATGGVARMGFRERLRLIPYEAVVGLACTAVSTLIYAVWGK